MSYRIKQQSARVSEVYVDDIKVFTGSMIECEDFCDQHQIVSHGKFGNYNKQQLREAFQRVQDKSNWKNKIKQSCWPELNEKQKDLISEAVIFFTGSEPKFSQINDKNLGIGTRVTAAGYYATIGA